MLQFREVKKVLQNYNKDFTSNSKRSIIREEWNEEDHPRDENGRFGNGGSGDGESSEDSSGGPSSDEGSSGAGGGDGGSSSVSATGANEFQKGFSQANGRAHWGSSHDHSAEYIEEGIVTTRSEYKARALELLQSPVGGDILGYKTPRGQVVRYDKARNDFVKGRPSQGIATMFKPTEGEEYFNRRMEKEGGIDHD